MAGSPAAAAASPWPPAPSSDATRRAVPVERDLISKLQFPKVIKPRPARPLWTTICIDSSNIAVGGGVAYPETVSVSNKTAREVETELELPGALPAVVSGHHNNRVPGERRVQGYGGAAGVPMQAGLPAGRRRVEEDQWCSGTGCAHVRPCAMPAECRIRRLPVHREDHVGARWRQRHRLPHRAVHR